MAAWMRQGDGPERNSTERNASYIETVPFPHYVFASLLHATLPTNPHHEDRPSVDPALYESYCRISLFAPKPSFLLFPCPLLFSGDRALTELASYLQYPRRAGHSTKCDDTLDNKPQLF